MNALILQHTISTPPGTTLDWLHQNKIPYQVLMVKDIEAWPDMRSFDLLFICGGAMNVDQEDVYPWLKAEKQFIAAAIQAGKKVVGLCLGSQLVAEILGAKVYPHGQWEAGWYPVKLQNGKDLTVFEWHAYTFDLPPKSELMATNDQCRHQAYKVGSQIVAFQFHPEANEEWVLGRTTDSKAPTHGFIQTSDQIKKGIGLYLPVLKEWYFKTLSEHIRN